MSSPSPEMQAIFDYIKEKIESDNWTCQRINGGKDKKGWRLQSGNKTWDIRVDLFENARLNVEFSYYKKSFGSEGWEIFHKDSLLDDVNFTRVDMAMKMLDTFKGGMKNWGNFNEFGEYTGG